MYKSFRVQNFRGFRDLRLDDLARVNLIAGKNNTGKSALLEAIFTYTGDYDASRLMRMPAPIPDRAGTTGMTNSFDNEVEGSVWEVLFHNHTTTSPIRMRADLQEDLNSTESCTSSEDTNWLEVGVVNIDVLPDDSLLTRIAFRGDYNIPSWLLEFRPGAGDPVHLAWVRRYDKVELKPDHHFPAVFIPSSEMMPRPEIVRRFSDLLFARRKPELLEILREFEPRLVDLSLVGEPSSIHGDLEDLRKLLPVSSMGEGMRRITSLMLAISTTENGIVLIDEIENGLHYSVQTRVWQAIAEAARAYNVQIFATTHSHEMILAAHEAFSEKNPCDLRYFRLSRDRDTNDIQGVAYEPETLEAAIEVGFEVR
ncbi:MAG: AAA family ATPase [Anaerolineaceae bacterium]|nr:AAA family ATPase [Anaerolineaceae bacterium]